MVMIVWAMIIALILLNLFLFKKFKTQQKAITNLGRVLNHIAQESAHTNWISKCNKEDLILIKDALNLTAVKELA